MRRIKDIEAIRDKKSFSVSVVTVHNVTNKDVFNCWIGSQLRLKSRNCRTS